MIDETDALDPVFNKEWEKIDKMIDEADARADAARKGEL